MKAPNVKNAVKSACRVVKATVQGKRLLLDEETIQQRLKICKDCPKLDPTSRQCGACTCFVDLKAQLATEKCPLHKWPVTNLN